MVYSTMIHQFQKACNMVFELLQNCYLFKLGNNVCEPLVKSSPETVCNFGKIFIFESVMNSVPSTVSRELNFISSQLLIQVFEPMLFNSGASFNLESENLAIQPIDFNFGSFVIKL